MNHNPNTGRRHRNGWLLTLAAGLLCLANASAQGGGGYELRNGAFTTVAGSVTNGAYRVTGTFTSGGGSATNGGYALRGSFATFDVVQTPGLPFLTLTGSGAGFVLSWPASSGDFRLQFTPALVTPNWVDVALPVVVMGSDKTVTVPVAVGRSGFYRLFKP